MNTLINKIERISIFSILVLTLVALSSCTKDECELFGVSASMKWKINDYLKINENGKEYFVVPSVGGIYEFNCLNYNMLSFGDITSETEGKSMNMFEDESLKFSDDFKHLSNDICEISIDGNTIKAKFYPNTNHKRKVNYLVVAGNSGHTFFFVQEEKQD